MKKLKAKPEKPYSQGDILKAMGELHKLVTKQSHAYGGKHHRFIPAEVIEEKSLLLQIANGEDEELFEADDSTEVERLLDLCEEIAQDLEEHIKETEDERGAKLIHILIQRLSAVMKEVSK